MRHEGFLLDLDNTLYDYESAHEPAISATFEFLASKTKHSVEVIDLNYKKARGRIHTQLHGLAASHSRLLYFQYVLEQLNLIPYELAVAAENYYWDQFFKNMVLRPGCKQFLETLKPRPLVVITDLTATLQLKKITHLGLQNYVSGIVTSEEAGCEKPDKRIFELAIAKSTKRPDQLCMIGDSWDRDILGALQFDMSCFWLNNSDLKKFLPKKVIEFKCFSALANMVHVDV